MSDDKDKDVKTTNHLIHAVLSVLTGGLWLPVWLLAYLGGSTRTVTFVLALILAALAVAFK